MNVQKPWLWPDHIIGKRESRRLRDEHNATIYSNMQLLAVLKTALELLEDAEQHYRNQELPVTAGEYQEAIKAAKTVIACATRGSKC